MMSTTSTGIRSEVLVDSKWLEEHLDDPRVRVVEVDVSPAAYGEGHIPGAVLWNIYSDLKDAEYRLRDAAAIEALVERSGIGPDTTVVFYGYGPAIGFWLLKLFRHVDARILDASRETWQAQGRPWSTTADPAPLATRYPLPREDEHVRARQAEVARAVGRPGHVILDVRSDDEYRGERFWPSGGMEEGGRAGHIPGAVHAPADRFADADGAFRPTAELAELYAPLGLDDADDVITYCTIGARAATTWFVLTHLLGHERTRVYDGSWAEWGRMQDTPVVAP